MLLAKKQRLGPKFKGGWAREASKKFGTPYVFLQPLKLATLNLVHNLGLGLAYQKTTFLTKIGRGSEPGEHPKKIWDPLRIFATVVNNFGLDEIIWEDAPRPCGDDRVTKS